MEHYYVFFHRRSSLYPTYERTCGTQQAAEQRVATLQDRGYRAFYMLNELPKGCWFY